MPTALLAFVGPGDWVDGAVLFAIASLGFWGGLIFYDSMLVQGGAAQAASTPSRASAIRSGTWAAGCC